MVVVAVVGKGERLPGSRHGSMESFDYGMMARPEPGFDQSAAAIDIHRCIARRSSVRAGNLTIAARLAGGMARLADQMASAGHQINGSHVSNRMARAIETLYALPDGWMDEARAFQSDREIHRNRAAAIAEILMVGDERTDVTIEVLDELLMHDPSDIDWLLSRACDYAYDAAGEIMEARWFVVGNHLCPDASSLIARTIEEALGMERCTLDR